MSVPILDPMDRTTFDIRTVAVIGAGVSGVAAAVHLKRAGLDVIVYERSKRAGGIWVYDPRIAKDPAYPSLLPSTGDSPEYDEVTQAYKHDGRADSPLGSSEDVHISKSKDVATSFAPPGPCYKVLKNNVSTIEMEMTCQYWKPGTEEFVPHHVMADYIHDSAEANDALDCFSFNTRVKQVQKVGKQWEIQIARMVDSRDQAPRIVDSVEHFDAVVVAAGHYHACNIPDLPGLSEWKARFPDCVRHSKLYRSPEAYKGQNVLIIGSGVSSMDIARDLGDVARTVYQSSRGGMFDIPSHLLPENGARVGAVESFDTEGVSSKDGKLSGTVTLASGEQLCNINQVIVATGYHISLPFMRQYHADNVSSSDADEKVIITDGQQNHNLHKDIWYIPDPTLAFVGVPYHVATFSFFEFQAIALAAVFSGQASLESHGEMKKEYEGRIQAKGAGRLFHSMKARNAEIDYVLDLVKLVNENRGPREEIAAVVENGAPFTGHSTKFHEAYIRRGVRHKAIFGKSRDPELDRRVLDMIEGC